MKTSILIDHPPFIAQRYQPGMPHQLIATILRNRQDAYLSLAAQIVHRYKDPLIDMEGGGTYDPMWSNKWFSGLDAIALYGITALNRPKKIVEIGSGHSTRFFFRARMDNALSFSLVVIDPNATLEAHDLADKIIPHRLDEIDPNVFKELEAGDILFLDCTHRVFQNSDVAVFFLDILPRLKDGVIVHLHDIFLPFDYPNIWADRFYSEQYMLAAYLIGGARRMEVMLPVAFLQCDLAVKEKVLKPWEDCPNFFESTLEATGGWYGSSFWFKVTGGKK